MTHIIRFVDIFPDQQNGTLVDMEYYEENSEFKIADVRCHSVLNGTVGSLVDVDPMIKLAFAGYLLQILKSNK